MIASVSSLSRGEKVALLAGLVLVFSFYGWTASTSGQSNAVAGQRGDYYSLLVHGFLKGHLYLDVPVDPAIVAATDPYDPAVRQLHRALPDASYYRGHYYIYFGVVPAVLFLLPYRILTGTDLSLPIAIDLVAGLAFLSLIGLWLRVRRAYFPSASALTVACTIVVFGVATGALTAVRRPDVWDFPIVAGFLFTTLTLHALFSAVQSEKKRPALAAAGILFALTIGSRPSQLGAILGPLGLLGLSYIFERRDTKRAFPSRSWWTSVLAFGAGFGGVLTLVCWYNYARFNNPLEFGLTYQFTDPPHFHHVSLSTAFVPFNFKLYYAGALNWTRYFPFATMADPGPMPAGHQAIETVYGQALYTPAIWFALATPLALVRRTPGEARRLGIILAVIALVYLGANDVDLLFVGATWRYITDFIPYLLLLGAIGALSLDRFAATKVTRLTFRTLWIGATTLSAAVACIVSIPLWGEVVLRRGIPYYERMARVLNSPTSWVESALGWHHGPVTFEGITFPTRSAGASEKLIETPGASVLVNYPREGQVRFGIHYTGAADVHWSEANPVATGESHTVTATFGALFPTIEHPYYSSHLFQPLARSVGAIDFDGRRVFEEFRTVGPGDCKTITIASRTSTPRPGWFSGNISAIRRLAPFPTTDITARFEPWRLGFQAPARPGRWPLLSAGTGDHGDLLFLDVGAGQVATLGYFHPGAAVRHSREFKLTPDVPVEFALVLEQLSPASRMSKPAGLLLVERDGDALWLDHVPYFPCSTDDIHLGENTVSESDGESRFPTLIQRLPAQPHSHPTSPADALVLKVVFPDRPRWGLREPLLISGPRDAADIVSLRYFGGGLIRFECEHQGKPVDEGLVYSGVDSALPHTIEISTRLFASDTNSGHTGRGIIVAKLDGIEGLRAETDLSLSLEPPPAVASNSIGAPNYAEQFSGELLLVRWIKPVDR